MERRKMPLQRADDSYDASDRFSGVLFPMTDGKIRVVYRVSYEALQDRASADGSGATFDAVETFLKHRPRIEQIASEKYDAGVAERVVTTAELTPLPAISNPPNTAPTAGTAPVENKASVVELHAADLVVGAERFTRGLAANTIENRRAAQALLEATQTAIAKLRDKRSNDPDTGELIDFLDWLAMGLTTLVENLDRAIAEPASEPMFLGTAGEIAHQLKLGLMEAMEKNRARIWEVGAYVGAASFLYWLGGEDLAKMLTNMFEHKK
jgi:hypothetical protein